MKHRCRHVGFRLFASVSALPAVLFASAAFAQSPGGAARPAGSEAPFSNAVTQDELAALRGGASVTGGLPSVRLWDEVGGRGTNRQAPSGGAPLGDGTQIIRVRGGR